MLIPLTDPFFLTIKSMAQNGLDSIKVFQIPGLIKSMMNGGAIPKIAGIKKGNTYWINEGHHRVAAALEIYNKNGDASHIMKLLKEGIWDPGTPIRDIPMTLENEDF